MAKCMYCSEPAVAPETIRQLCRKHMEMSAIMFALKVSGRPVTTASIRDYLALVSDPIALQPGEVARLLQQMRRHERKEEKNA